jgi:pyruvate/2-oxoglutarate dehydrogenase complex dihydrolipoamide dehydrogenase (E3) component
MGARPTASQPEAVSASMSEGGRVGEVLRPDLCVIGAGSGGLSVAAIAASFGVPVVLIEKGRMGGDCLNVGCVPSKALIAAAARAHAARTADAFGVEWANPRSDPARLRAHIEGVIAAIAPNDSAARFSALGVQVILAAARFTGRRSVVAGDAVIEARRVVLACGSVPALPPIPGLDAVPYLTNETVFDLDARPERLIVIGGGPIGVELAQAHRRLGAEVVILEAARILPRDDPEMAAVVERALARDGVEIHAGVAIEGVERREERIVLTVRTADGWRGTVTGSHLLVATGRRPVTDGLGLEAAGIAFDGSGIKVDKGLRTTNKRVYAIGDCVGGEAGALRFTHVANYHAGIVVRRALFRLPARVDNAKVPRVTFTDPELASVGLSEEEARASHRAIRILRWPLSENDRAQAERATDGHLKAVVTRGGRILGCAIAAPHAGDLIVPWALALSKGLKVQDLAGIVFPYPTLSEVTKRAAVEFVRPAAQNPWLRRVIAAVRRLG